MYLIECANEALYCGIAIDVEKRYAQHLAGKGARYTRSWPPKRLVLALAYRDRAAASRAEVMIKRLPPRAKRALATKSAAAVKRLLRTR